MSKLVKNSVTYFMDGPRVKVHSTKAQYTAICRPTSARNDCHAKCEQTLNYVQLLADTTFGENGYML